MPEWIERFAALPMARQFVRFAAIGVAATATHYAILIALVEAGGQRPLLATTIGFCFGTLVSYALNRRYTFQAGNAGAWSFAKFFILYAVGMALNAAIMAGLIDLGAPYLGGQIAATGVVLVWNFLGARFVVFRR